MTEPRCCNRCGSSNLEFVLTPELIHYGKLVCPACDCYVCWVPKPKPEPEPEPQPKSLKLRASHELRQLPRYQTWLKVIPPPPPSANGPSEQEVWQYALQWLSPAAQSLLKVHGKFQFVAPNIAQIWMRSDPLLRMAQRHHLELETALSRVCQRIVRVKFLQGEANEKV
jgi:hypothetical protein